MFRLADKHLERAKEIASINRKKKTCNTCYDRGYIGTTADNTILLCHKCIDLEKAIAAWKEYIIDFPELKEYYKELFEEKKLPENDCETRV